MPPKKPQSAKKPKPKPKKTPTPNQPRRCSHKDLYRCTWQSPLCCSCDDERPHRNTYTHTQYINGSIATTPIFRWSTYCGECQRFWESQGRLSGVGPADSPIPGHPNPVFQRAADFSTARGPNALSGATTGSNGNPTGNRPGRGQRNNGAVYYPRAGHNEAGSSHDTFENLAPPDSTRSYRFDGWLFPDPSLAQPRYRSNDVMSREGPSRSQNLETQDGRAPQGSLGLLPRQVFNNMVRPLLALPRTQDSTPQRTVLGSRPGATNQATSQQLTATGSSRIGRFPVNSASASNFEQTLENHFHEDAATPQGQVPSYIPPPNQLQSSISGQRRPTAQPFINATPGSSIGRVPALSGQNYLSDRASGTESSILSVGNSHSHIADLASDWTNNWWSPRNPLTPSYHNSRQYGVPVTPHVATPEPSAEIDLSRIAEEASILLELFSKTSPHDHGLIDTALASITQIHRELRVQAAGNSTMVESEEEVEELKVESGCIICYSRLADTVLMPCGHLVLCGVCCQTLGVKGREVPGPRTAKCPICRVIVLDKKRIFRG